MYSGHAITVELVLHTLGAGRSFADILEAYPQLTQEDLCAALAFAADYLQHDPLLLIESLRAAGFDVVSVSATNAGLRMMPRSARRGARIALEVEVTALMAGD